MKGEVVGYICVQIYRQRGVLWCGVCGEEGVGGYL